MCGSSSAASDAGTILATQELGPAHGVGRSQVQHKQKEAQSGSKKAEFPAKEFCVHEMFAGQTVEREIIWVLDMFTELSCLQRT